MRTKFITLRMLVALHCGVACSDALRCAPASAGPKVLVAANAMTNPDGLRPTPGNPIYYVFAQSQEPLGTIVAGVKLPPPAMVKSAVVAELGKQGFLRAEKGGPKPAIYILAVVGDANFAPATDDEIAFYLPAAGYDPQKAAWLAFKNSPRYKDKPIMDAIIGADQTKILTGPKADLLAYADNEDRYYVSVIAFDAALMAQKKMRVLWRTSMSVPFQDDFEQTLPTMLASGGPFFGRDLKEPEFIADAERRKAEVKMGELTVVPDDTEPASKQGPKK